MFPHTPGYDLFPCTVDIQAIVSFQHEYDVILMDIRMPVLNGLEAAKQIRALDRPDAKTVPIIAVTANAYR